jgi:hypothetical protein
MKSLPTTSPRPEDVSGLTVGGPPGVLEVLVGEHGLIPKKQYRM